MLSDWRWSADGRTIGVIDEAEAVSRILQSVQSLGVQQTALAETLGRYAAQAITARVALPPFDNSAMDGYAVIASSCKPGARLRVTGEQPAGPALDLAVHEGEAIRIFTGGPLPRAADAVVMQEDVTRDGDEILISAEVEQGEFVRRLGGDVAAGQQIVEAGGRIRAETIALLAAQGIATLEVGRAASAAVISTGDELVPAGRPLQAGQIYDANLPLLRAMLERIGVHVASATHCPDRREAIEAALRAGIAHDVLIISGGVSVGARDLVKPALVAVGAKLDLWRVAVKPGKPFLFGRSGKCAIFGLPGNPVSAFVTMLLFVRPAVLKMMGARDAAIRLPTQSALLADAVANESDRPHYLRGSVRDGVFSPVGRQESHALYGLSRSNALLRVPPGGTLEAGARVTLFSW